MLCGLNTNICIKLFTGVFVLNYATTERLLKDMNNNCISKAVIQQINPPNKNSADMMEEIVTQNERLYTFGAIHPFDENIDSKIKHYMNLHIKGWKINPHVYFFVNGFRETFTQFFIFPKNGIAVNCSILSPVCARYFAGVAERSTLILPDCYQYGFIVKCGNQK